MTKLENNLNLLSFSLDDLILEFQSRYGKGKFHAEAIYRAFYKNANCTFRNLPEFDNASKLLEKIQIDFTNTFLDINKKISEDDTIKFTTKTDDNLEFESVIIPMKKYKTICISSQIGCKMKCKFCETGKMGLHRNLSVSEIVGQVYQALSLWKLDIKNIVFMGMGEPLDNFDNVIKSIKILTEPRGMNFNLSNITISTVGNVDFINKLAKLKLENLNLAISINASNDKIRSDIMPINKKHSMQKLKDALLSYPLKKNGIFFIEYVLIKDINDSAKCANELAEYLKNLRVKINLIPYNPSKNSIYNSPDDISINNFYKILTDKGLFVRKRISKGHNLKAACGQLGNN